MTLEVRRFEKALSLARKAHAELNLEIARHKEGRGVVGSLLQLEKMRSQLLGMELELSSGEISERHLGMGRVISDSWPWGSSLGEALLAAEQGYRELARNSGADL